MSKSESPSKSTGLNLAMLWRFMEGERLRYGAAIAALILSTCFMYLVPLVPQIVLDGVLAPDGTKISAFVLASVEVLGGKAYLLNHLWWPAFLMVFLTSMAGLFTYLRGRWSAVASEGISRKVRDTIYDHLQHLPCSYHDQADSGDLVQRCTSDVETLNGFLSTQLVEAGRAIIMLVIPLPLMLVLNRPMTLVSLAIIFPIAVFSIVFFRKVRVAFKKADEAEGRMTSVLQESLTGIRVVRAFANQEFEKEKFGARNGDHRQLNFKLYVLFAAFWSFSDFMCLLQKALVVGMGCYWLYTGELQVGTFFFFLAAVELYIWPIRRLGRVLADLGKATVAIGRIGEILEVPREVDTEKALTPSGQIVKAVRVPARAATTAGSSIQSHSTYQIIQVGTNSNPVASPRNPAESVLEYVPGRVRGSIELDRVCFSYDGRVEILKDVSLSVKAGQIVALLGPSGSGKSTLAQLLLRNYDPTAGTIRLDGQDIQQLGRKWVRSQIAVVMQEPFLFSKTIKENIRLGLSNAADEQITSAAVTSCVDDAIRKFDDGYETMVGERGVTLSGGQRQRVALARALLSDAPLMILDDAFSAVDSETEALILEALNRRHYRQTTLLISHRIKTLMHADRILVFDKGRIIQRGTHEELIREEGRYRRIWEIQRAVEIPVASP